ncbi:MAG: NAD(P)-dependent oxidoreductase [Chloroflexota bacterium]|nr:NAD(P)-dependent oxidoreductase [Chloroflexota bacterium]MDE2968903.1 NAD(P)-dependent oxidoreductase [Chloroflexota bacterium]
MKVGFIGIGAMGNHMVRHLQAAGHELTLHDLRREAATPFLEAGADWGDSPKAVAQASDVVFTSLPGPTDVETVALGPEGVAEGASPGKVYVDLSTNSPVLTRRLHADMAAKGIRMLDCPVSGGTIGAQEASLALLVGGDRDLYEEVLPVLRAIGDKPIYCGPSGAGQVCKLVNNYITLSLQPLLAEAFSIGVKAGVDAGTLFEAVSRSTGNTRSMQWRYPPGVLKGEFTPTFTVDLVLKDLGLAIGLAEDFDVPLQFGPLAYGEYAEASRTGRGRLDVCAVALLQEERAGVEIRADVEPR